MLQKVQIDADTGYGGGCPPYNAYFGFAFCAEKSAVQMFGRIARGGVRINHFENTFGTDIAKASAGTHEISCTN